MVYILDKKVWKEDNEAVIKTEIGDVVLRLETKAMSLSSKIIVYDRYHVEIGFIKKRGFIAGWKYDIYFDERVVSTLSKKRRFFIRRFVLKTSDGMDFLIKGKVRDDEYQIIRKSKVYAKASPALAHHQHQFGIETKDDMLKYSFLCAAVILSMQ